MTIAQALKRGITAVTHPSWKLGHLHIEQFGSEIIVRGKHNSDGKPSWLEDVSEMDITDEYVEWRQEDGLD